MSIDFSGPINDNGPVVSRPHQRLRFATNHFMSKKTATASTVEPAVAPETDDQRFNRILSRPEFKSLKAVLGHLGSTPAVMNAALITTNSYQIFLGKLGYRIVLVKEIHENVCYSRLGPAGGIRAVLPVHDMATYSTMVTLVNFDSTVTTTPNSIDYYDRQLAEFKTQLMNRRGDAR